MAINMNEKNIFQHMKDFLTSHPKNPVSDESVIVAKDLQFYDQDANESFMLLCPLSEKDSFAFIKPYFDERMDDVKYTLTVASIKTLKWNEDESYRTFTSPYVGTELTKFSKGARYCLKFIDYFDPKKNVSLYNSITKPNIHIPNKKFFDSDDKKRQESGGYVEIESIKMCHEGETHISSMIKSFRSTQPSGEREAPKVFMILSDEWEFFFSFLQWACQTYRICAGESPIEQTRIRNAHKQLLSSLTKRKKRLEEAKKVKDNAGPSVEDSTTPSPPSKKPRKSSSESSHETSTKSASNSKDKSKKKKKKKAESSQKQSKSPSPEEGISASKSQAALESLGLMPKSATMDDLFGHDSESENNQLKMIKD